MRREKKGVRGGVRPKPREWPKKVFLASDCGRTSNSRGCRALLGYVRKDDEKELSIEPGAVITGIRPAVWLVDGWLEGALDGRVGLVHVNYVDYLQDCPK